jgi:hypothetical protein
LILAERPGVLFGDAGGASSLARGRYDMENIRTENPCPAHPPVSFDSAGVSAPSFVEALIDPVSVFRHPTEVAEHPWFTDQEKRAILMSWARDELVVEQVASKVIPELTPRSRIDAVVEALAPLDEAAAGEYRSAVTCIRRARKGCKRPRAMH